MDLVSTTDVTDTSYKELANGPRTALSDSDHMCSVSCTCELGCEASGPGEKKMFKLPTKLRDKPTHAETSG